MLGAASLAAWAAFVVGPAAAAGPQLLPADDAFRFAARTLDTNAVEARFSIAEGYYLYRDKLRFAAAPALGLVAPSLPAGQIKEDAFFGRVETYRGEVLVRLAVPDGKAGTTVTIEADSQGCADVGVCYPATRQKVTLVLPGADARPGAFVEANPAKKGWFK
jgi:thiol:disulfide interchange protein DsbD